MCSFRFVSCGFCIDFALSFWELVSCLDRWSNSCCFQVDKHHPKSNANNELSCNWVNRLPSKQAHVLQQQDSAKMILIFLLIFNFAIVYSAQSPDDASSFNSLISSECKVKCLALYPWNRLASRLTARQHQHHVNPNEGPIKWHKVMDLCAKNPICLQVRRLSILFDHVASSDYPTAKSRSSPTTFSGLKFKISWAKLEWAAYLRVFLFPYTHKQVKYFIKTTPMKFYFS